MRAWIGRVDGVAVHPTVAVVNNEPGRARRSAPALLAPALEEADHVPGRIGRFEPHVEAP